MKLVVLVDNNTYIDQYYLGEPALSIYIENAGNKYLFDTGYTDVYVKNAAAMGLSLDDLEAVIISHGHNDHTGGLAYFPNSNTKPKLVAHPGIMDAKRAGGLAISIPLSEAYLQSHFKPVFTTEPYWLDESLAFLGEIPRTNSFENKEAVGELCCGACWQGDYVRDDSALAYVAGDGIYIITGCSHAGICNIVEYAKNVTGKSLVKGIIGGLHLFSGCSEQAVQTVAYLKANVQGIIYPCHCTNLAAKVALY
ncbi:MAG: MBL fold metallo-hydrolase, partial [Phascolarctobacterium sp.]